MGNRDLGEVLAEVVKLIPPEEVGLIADLARVQNSVMYAAPEMKGYFWREASEAIYHAFPERWEDYQQWQQDVLRVWNPECGCVDSRVTNFIRSQLDIGNLRCVIRVGGDYMYIGLARNGAEIDRKDAAVLIQHLLQFVEKGKFSSLEVMP